jgi:hypothetical protein
MILQRYSKRSFSFGDRLPESVRSNLTFAWALDHPISAPTNGESPEADALVPVAHFVHRYVGQESTEPRRHRHAREFHEAGAMRSNDDASRPG